MCPTDIIHISSEIGLKRNSIPRLPRVLLVLGGAGLVTEVGWVTLGVADVDLALRNYLVTAISFIAAAAILAAGCSRSRGARAPWLLLGMGVFSYSAGSLLFFFVLGPITS